MLIAGYSGIGKTSLVQEIYKPITQRRGYFIAGKFDQYQRDIPYSAFVDAFASWVEQLLTEPEDQLNQWREKLLTALVPNATVMIEVLSELELILGPQPPVPELPPSEAKNRFNQVFQQFIQVLTQPEHPLVIFLDDLQWADAASLQLMQLLMTSAVPFLLLLGAYRDNEVSAAHPLLYLIEEIQKVGATVHTIVLSPLQRDDLSHLLADTLHRSPEAVSELADLVLAKTNGNPFFVNEFLRALYVEQLLTFDYRLSQWNWSISDIQQRNITDNVVELLVTKIQRLQPLTQDGLRRAACIGNQFDLQTLTFVLHSAGALAEPNPAAAIALLKEAVITGLILPLTDVYKRIELGVPQPGDELRVEYKFAHDRIQQAAYSLNSPDERTLIHYQIGQQLLRNTPAEQQPQKLFDIVNQLNLARTLITTEKERYELAQLNLLAGEKAIASNAYEGALRYLDVGRELLTPESWQTQYTLTLALYEATVVAEYLNANFDRAILVARTVLQQAINPLDKVKVYELKIQMCMAQFQLVQAIGTGLSVLEMLGVSLEPAAPHTEVPETLIQLPEMTDPAKLAAMQILVALVAPTFVANPELFPQVIFTLVHLSIQYGNAACSAYGYVVYGWLLCGRYLEIDLGYRYGELGLKVLDQFNANSLKCKVLTWHNTYVRHWKEHYRTITEPLQEALQVGLQTGDIEYAGFAGLSYCPTLFFVGEHLETFVQKCDQYIELMQKLNHEYSRNYIQIYKQFGLNLTDAVEDPLRLIGSDFNEVERVPILQAAKNVTILGNIYLTKTILCYLFRQPRLALDNARATERCAISMIGCLNHAEHIFYYSLALLAHYPEAESTEQLDYLQQVSVNQEKMQQWANHAPCNFQHKLDLVAAEKARITGKFFLAMELYDRAIAGAREQGYLHEEALASELAAEFYRACGREKIAQTYLIDAYYGYTRWGAKRKVSALEATYPQLPAQLAKQDSGYVSVNRTTTLTTGADSATLDLLTVLKASQVLSGELNLQKLLAQLMPILLQNAGAQTGVLLLESEQQLRVEATGTVDPTEVFVQQSILLEDTAQLPISLIQYVVRRQETVVLEDAARDSRFALDRYIQAQQPKSILCTPIQGHGKLIGILYLENNLTTGAFTPDRSAILRVLTSQAAIALENAQLYEQLAGYSQTLETNNQALQEEVSERRRVEEQLRQSLAEREVLLKEIHHRVKNNLQIISGLLQLQSQSITDASTINILRESQYRIESMSLIHKKLYASSDFGQIDLADYVPSLASNLLSSYQITPDKVTLQMAIDSIILNIDQAIPCGLIVNELISNALKHAFPNGRRGEIQIQLHVLGNTQVALTIQDNGIGLPETVDWEYAQSLGLSLVHDLVVEQLEGKLSVERQGGTVFKIQFPQAPLLTPQSTVDRSL